jgi:hypothetical protein
MIAVFVVGSVGFYVCKCMVKPCKHYALCVQKEFVFSVHNYSVE